MAQYSKPPKPTTKADVVAYAREWLKTPYMHQTSRIGVGCDCLGLLRGVWESIYETEAERPPNYTPVWAEIRRDGQEPMLEAAHRHLNAISLEAAVPGDVILIRVRKQSAIKHCGIIAPNNSIIHAYDRHDVVEEPMRTNWKPRNLYAFAFPGVTD